MSSSSDGRLPPRPRSVDARPPEPDTRAAGRYAQPPRSASPSVNQSWNEPAADEPWHQEAFRNDYEPPPRAMPHDFDPDPRTGPATFEFHPSPLQPRHAQASAGTAERGRLPQRPEDLRDGGATQTRRPDPNLDLGGITPAASRAAPNLSAPTRAQRTTREMANAPIVPPGSVTGKSLTLVIAIMCFLACLTTGAVYMMTQSASAWLRDIASEVTVQVESLAKVDIERQVRDVAAFLVEQPGVTAAKPLTLEASASLLEPWLGSSVGLKSLPVPRMIAVEVDRRDPPDFARLRVTLANQFRGTSLDDHRQWQAQIRTVTHSFALGGLAILMLVGAATTAVIVSATRSAMASNREIVEVLHFVGATDRFIARQFQAHFLRLGVRAGVVGAVLAGLSFLAMPFAMEFLGGGSTNLADLQRLVGTGSLDLIGYGWLAIVVVVIAALCMLTSRIGVYRILNSQH